MTDIEVLNKYNKQIDIKPLLICNIDKELKIKNICGDVNNIFNVDSDILIMDNILTLSDDSSDTSNKSFSSLIASIERISKGITIKESTNVYIGKKYGIWYEVDVVKRSDSIMLIWYYIQNSKKVLEGFSLEQIEKSEGKIEYFADVSHELRTPLNVILGVVQLLSHQLDNGNISDRDKKLNEYLSITRFNSLRLLRLVNNIIDLTKIDSGYLEITQRKCNIVSFVEDITDSITPYIDNKNIGITFDTDNEEVIALIDPIKMEKVILNILSNAIKFTQEEGSISVNISTDSNINISIKDNGIGMEKDKLQLIFQRYAQINSGYTRKNEGSGIGLSLARHIVNQHGGDIEVYSEKGSGSEFIIKLPYDVTMQREDGFEAYEYRSETIELELSDICFHK
ncbi:MAG: HAMP domain-containing sensor histidine kinase [Clostridium sp.]|uniref:sensor histidine kinase n=1 Tax=Clostridium sp. TaxID=1506 RepID=UPI002FC8A88B